MSGTGTGDVKGRRAGWDEDEVDALKKFEAGRNYRLESKIGLESGQVRKYTQGGAGESWSVVQMECCEGQGGWWEGAPPKKAVGLARVSESTGESSSPNVAPVTPNFPPQWFCPFIPTESRIHA